MLYWLLNSQIPLIVVVLMVVVAMIVASFVALMVEVNAVVDNYPMHHSIEDMMAIQPLVGMYSVLHKRYLFYLT